MSAVGLPTKGVMSGGAAAAAAVVNNDPCAGFPGQYWLIRDAKLQGAAAVTAESEYGPRTGFVVPDEDNAGNLIAAVVGEPDDETAAELSLRVVRGGKIGKGEYLYRPDEEEWRGANADIYPWGHHCPVASSHPRGAVLLYSRVYRRVIVCSTNTTGGVLISYVDADERPTGLADWDTTSFTPNNGVHSGNAALAGCELGDGTLLLGVRRALLQSGGGSVLAEGDWDLYRSRDGGMTWDLLRENMLQELQLPADLTYGNTVSRMAAAGSWVRWVFLTTVSGMVTAVSSDRGSSWSTVADLTIGGTGPEERTDQNNDEVPYDLIGADDQGTFLFVANKSADAVLWYASQDDDWTESSQLSGIALTGAVRDYVLLRDPYWIYLYVGGFDVGVQGRFYAARVRRDQAISGNWTNLALPYNLQGAVRLVPTKIRGTWVGDRFAVLQYLMDSQETGWPLETDRPVLHWMGGWSTRPMATESPGEWTQLLHTHWSYQYGQPAGGATSATQTGWINTTTAGGTHSWSVFAMAFETYTGGDVSAQRLTTENLPPYWDGSSAEIDLLSAIHRASYEWTMATGATGNATATNVALRVKMPSRVYDTGPAWELLFRIGPTQTVVVNEATGVPLATIATLTSEDVYRRYRFCVSPAASPADPYGILQWRREGGDVWHDTGRFALGQPNAAAGITQFSLQFGHLAHTPGSTMYSYWREVAIYDEFSRVDYARSGGFLLRELPGALLSPRPRALGCGSTGTDAHRLSVYWSGGGAGEADSWVHTLEHANAAELVMVDSPRTAWLSAAGATAGTALVYDACQGAAVDTGERFVHSHIALYGLQNRIVLVDYADDAAFTSGVVAGATITADQYSGIRVDNRNGRTLLLDPSTTTGIRPGELAERYLHVSAAAAAGGFNTIHRVEQHVYDGTNHLVTLATGGQFAASVISVGDTIRVFSDRAWGAHDATVAKRYLRLRFGQTGANNWDGRWRLGQLVAGIARRFDPPLDWAFTDEETPNAVIETSRGGQSWAYSEGPASRLFVGRQIGDVTGARAELRDLLRTLGNYVEQPVALLLNGDATEDQDRMLLLARFEGPTSLDNQAWVRDGDGVERPAGDLAVLFREIV